MIGRRSFLVIVSIFGTDGTAINISTELVHNAPFNSTADFAAHLRSQAPSFMDICVLDCTGPQQEE